MGAKNQGEYLNKFYSWFKEKHYENLSLGEELLFSSFLDNASKTYIQICRRSTRWKFFSNFFEGDLSIVDVNINTYIVDLFHFICAN